MTGLRLYALLAKQILPENTGPPCNYKIIRGAGPPSVAPLYLHEIKSK